VKFTRISARCWGDGVLRHKAGPLTGRVTVGRNCSTFELYACAIQRWLKARAELAALL
jgi:hypothetical protein